MTVFTQFIRPVLYETAGTRDDALFDRGLAGTGGLLEERPHEGDALQSFPEAHFVCHDTPESHFSHKD